MNPRRSSLVAFALVAISASAAFADDVSAPIIHKTPDRAVKAKLAKPTVRAGDRRDVKFSDPNALLAGATKGARPDLRPIDARDVPAEPNGGLSLGLKWRATNDHPDPFDAVRQTSGPNGPGDAVEGGIKLGF